MKPHEPLSPEERDLATRLTRLGGPREPAPALDAKILAAARAAVSAPEQAPSAAPSGPISTDTVPTDPMPADPKVVPLRPRRTSPRWPLGLGLAATLVLAAGIGWRLHGDGETGMEAAEDAAASAPAFEAAREDVTEAVILDAPVQRTPPPPPPQEIAIRQEEQRMRAPAASMPATAPAAPPAPSFVPDLSQDAAAAPEPVAAAADAAAGGNLSDGVRSEGFIASDKEKDLDRTVTVTGSRVAAPERSVGAAEYTRTPLNERREQAASKPSAVSTSGRAGTAAKTAAPPPPPPAAAPAAQNAVRDNTAAKRRADALGGTIDERKSEARPEPPPAGAAGTSDHLKSDETFDDQPPASADSPEVRQAWLRRIRDLIASGQTEAARNSLQEFRRRYPTAELPEDLRKLAATLPPPSP